MKDEKAREKRRVQGMYCTCALKELLAGEGGYLLEQGKKVVWLRICTRNVRMEIRASREMLMQNKQR